MVEFYLLTFLRFPLRKKEHKSYFGKNRTHDFRTSRCAGYLLDHSGGDRFFFSFLKSEIGPISDFKNPGFRSRKRWSDGGDAQKV